MRKEGVTLNAEGEPLASDLTELEAVSPHLPGLKAFRRPEWGAGRRGVPTQVNQISFGLSTVSNPCSLFLRPGS